MNKWAQYEKMGTIFIISIPFLALVGGHFLSLINKVPLSSELLLLKEKTKCDDDMLKKPYSVLKGFSYGFVAPQTHNTFIDYNFTLFVLCLRMKGLFLFSETLHFDVR